MRDLRLLRTSLAGLWVVGLSLAADLRPAFGQIGTNSQTVHAGPPRSATRPIGLAATSEVDQSAPISELPPTWMTYRFYFAHLLDLDRAADEQEKLGNEAAARGWRVHEQRAAELTDEEIAVLREVATECNDVVGRPSAGDNEPIVQAFIDRLRQALGPATFERLSQHVQATFQGDVRLIPPANGRFNPESVSPTLSTGPSISVASHITLDGLQARAMCQTTMNNLTDIDPITLLPVYPSVAPYCRLIHGTAAPVDVQCPAGNPTGSCSETVTVGAGEAVHAEAVHYLNMTRNGTCTYNFAERYPLGDKYHFGSYAASETYPGDPYPDYPETGEVPPHGSLFCTNAAAFVAYTTGQTVTAVEVTILPLGQEVLPGLKQQFKSTVNPSTVTQSVTWSIDKKVGTSDMSSDGLFTAPKNNDPAFTQTVTFTVKACSTVTPTACASTTFSVPKLSIEVIGTTPFLATPGATQTLNAIVHGTSQSLELNWTPPDLVGTGASATYTAPTANPIKDVTVLPVSACLTLLPDVCGALQLKLVPPVLIGAISPNLWAAGQHDANPAIQVSISGSGFGGAPKVTLSDTNVKFNQTLASNTSIQGTVTTPLILQENVTVAVTTTTDSLVVSGTGTATVTPPTTSMTISPTSGTLQETQTLQFTPSPTCKAGSFNCVEPLTLAWTTNHGKISNTGLYTASESISAQTTATVTVCSTWAPSIAACASATITLVPINVTVTPSAVSLKGCDPAKPFTATVTGAVTPTVTWSINPSVGTIDPQTGAYTAPCPFAGPQTSIVVKATSTVDPARSGQATVTLVPQVDNAGFVAQNPPAVRQTAGSKVTVSVTMQNTGTTSWSAGAYWLGSQNPPGNTNWGIARVDLAAGEVIQQNGQKTFTFDIVVPTDINNYFNFQWQMMHNSVGFGALTTNVAVLPGPRPLPPGIAPWCCAIRRGPTSGGTTIVIPGSNFVAGASVSFGGALARSVSVDNASQITAVTPAHTAGAVDIVVTNPDGQTGTFTSGFQYVDLAPAYQGSLDYAACDRIAGWAWDGNYPTTPINVDIYVDWVYVATVPAGNYRADLVAAGIGDGYHGYSVPTPSKANDGGYHWIDVRFPGTTSSLSGVRVIFCTDGATYVSQSVPASMAPGSTATVSITMRNSGSSTWTEADWIRLGSQNPDNNMTWGVGRLYLAPGETVAPGANKTFSFTITAPTTPGTYNFQWRMLREMIRWFGDWTPNVAVSVTTAPALSVTLINPVAGVVTGNVVFQAQVTGSQPASQVQYFANTSYLGTAYQPPYTFNIDTSSGNVEGSYTVYAKAFDGAGNSTTSAPVSVTVSNPHIACGGGAYTDPGGGVWAADHGFDGGSTFGTSYPISGTSSPALYQTERWSDTTFSYRLQVSTGWHLVTLKFAEIYFGVYAPGNRIENVVINGQTVLQNFDPLAAAGGPNIAVDRQFWTYTSDGWVTISFVPVVSNPQINAIRIQ